MRSGACLCCRHWQQTPREGLLHPTPSLKKDQELRDTNKSDRNDRHDRSDRREGRSEGLIASMR